MAKLDKVLAAVLGVSVFMSAPRAATASLGDKSVRDMRKNFGGQLQPLTFSQTRWYHQDLESAIKAADRGIMAPMARLWRACRTDGIFAGVLSTRTEGLVRLPIKFRGNQDLVAQLQAGAEEDGPNGPRSTFFEMCPPGELAAFAADIIGMNIAVAELAEVEGRDFPLFTRLDPEALVYIWNENRWYFRANSGLLPITPGDGKWVLYVGGRVTPWQFGIWRALGRAFIDKDHARNYNSSWEGKLAHPARVAMAPEGASETEFDTWFRRVAAWGVNTVFAVKPGYKVELVESNGIGYQSFGKTIARAEREGVIAIAGQEVTTTGGTGFANADIHKSIRADLIKATADALSYTINTQVLPLFTVIRAGVEALDESPCMEWDVEPAVEATAAADTFVKAAEALDKLSTVLTKLGGELDAATLCQRFGIPLKGKFKKVKLQVAPKPAADESVDVDTSEMQEAA